MVYCCVPFCQSKQGSGVSFHQFPSDIELSKIWLRYISREDFVINDKSPSSVVCSKHFKDDDYVSGLKVKKLKKGSIPTVFPGYPPHKLPSEQVPRRPPKKRVLSEKKDGPTSKKCLKLGNEGDNPEREYTVHTATISASHVNGDNIHDTEVYADSDFIIKEVNVTGPYEASYSTTVNTDSTTVNTEATISDAQLLLHFAASQVKFPKGRRKRSLVLSDKRVRNMQSLLWKKNRKIKKQQQEIELLKGKLKYYEKNEYHLSLSKLICLEDCEHEKARFLLEQIKNFFSKRPTWNEKTIRECVVWLATSPKGYNFVRERQLLTLPSKMTLSRFIGPISGEFGVTPLIQRRLCEETKKLNVYEKFCSLILDEMAIKPQCIFDQKMDAFFGRRSSLQGKDEKQLLANRVLCFMIAGLSTSYTIPCAYFFTRQLTGTELHAMTTDVLKTVEECGFFVVRIVCDNHKSNVSMFRNISGKKRGEKLTHRIQHPNDPCRDLFLSFDPNHVMKNIRTQLLEGEMTDGEEIISGEYIKLLYKFQVNENIKAVRNLTYKHIDPTTFEKMNVQRAVMIFSPAVTAALKFLKTNSHHHKASSFSNAGATITYLENIYKWFCMHDVSSRNHHIISNNDDRMHFFSCSDDRLEWMESEFLNYLENVKVACENHEPPLKFLTSETHEAVTITTMATVDCIRYLLKGGYHYVLTRSFNSDPVESLFSALRQMNGGNDVMDVRSTVCTLEKILKTGIIITSKYSNVGKRDQTISRKPTVLKYKASPKAPTTCTSLELPDRVLDMLDAIETVTIDAYAPVNLKFASIAFVAGFLVRVVEEKHDCIPCLERITSVSTLSPLLQLIAKQDRGNLRYPAPAFVLLISKIQSFVEEAIKLLPQNHLVQNLSQLIVPKLMKSPLLNCGIESHKTCLAKITCTKLLPVILKNHARNITDGKQIRIYNKPLCRKVLKLT